MLFNTPLRQEVIFGELNVLGITTIEAPFSTQLKIISVVESVANLRAGRIKEYRRHLEIFEDFVGDVLGYATDPFTEILGVAFGLMISRFGKRKIDCSRLGDSVRDTIPNDRLCRVLAGLPVGTEWKYPPARRLGRIPQRPARTNPS